MIAIGFTLQVIFILAYILTREFDNCPEYVENIFYILFLLGGTIVLAGILLLMWRYLP